MHYQVVSRFTVIGRTGRFQGTSGQLQETQTDRGERCCSRTWLICLSGFGSAIVAGMSAASRKADSNVADASGTPITGSLSAAQ